MKTCNFNCAVDLAFEVIIKNKSEDWDSDWIESDKELVKSALEKKIALIFKSDDWKECLDVFDMFKEE